MFWAWKLSELSACLWRPWAWQFHFLKKALERSLQMSHGTKKPTKTIFLSLSFVSLSILKYFRVVQSFRISGFWTFRAFLGCCGSLKREFSVSWRHENKADERSPLVSKLRNWFELIRSELMLWGLLVVPSNMDRSDGAKSVLFPSQVPKLQAKNSDSDGLMAQTPWNSLRSITGSWYFP